MRPAADGEDSHDANLQRDDGAGLKPHGKIERWTGLEIELEKRWLRHGVAKQHLNMSALRRGGSRQQLEGVFLWPSERESATAGRCEWPPWRPRLACGRGRTAPH